MNASVFSLSRKSKSFIIKFDEDVNLWMRATHEYHKILILMIPQYYKLSYVIRVYSLFPLWAFFGITLGLLYIH